MRKQGLSYRRIAAALNAAKWPTARGGSWSSSTVRSLLIQHGPHRAAQEARVSTFGEMVAEEMRARLASTPRPVLTACS